MWSTWQFSRPYSIFRHHRPAGCLLSLQTAPSRKIQRNRALQCCFRRNPSICTFPNRRRNKPKGHHPEETSTPLSCLLLPIVHGLRKCLHMSLHQGRNRNISVESALSLFLYSYPCNRWTMFRLNSTDASRTCSLQGQKIYSWVILSPSR